jgi:DNA-binding response OmpR family regulator
MNPSPDIAADRARILVVDDELDNREVLDLILTFEGFVILTAGSGEEAFASVARQRPDLILLDVMMPGMDGYQVVAKLKGNLDTQNIPVILVTALEYSKARMMGLSAGADDVLAKPMDIAELVLRVRNLLRLKASGDGHDKVGRDSLARAPNETPLGSVAGAVAAGFPCLGPPFSGFVPK